MTRRPIPRGRRGRAGMSTVIKADEKLMDFVDGLDIKKARARVSRAAR